MASGFPKDSSHLQLLISDFDGTLVGHDLVLSEDIIEAIKRWRDSGRRFTIATGRQHRMILGPIKKLGLTDPIAVRGGAEIVDPLTGDVLYSKLISKNVVKNLTKQLTENDFDVSIEQGDTIYSDYYRRPEFEDVITFKNLDEFEISDAPKMVFHGIKGNLIAKERYVDNVIRNEYKNLHITKTHPRDGVAWEVTSEEGTKHLAVLELIKMMNIEVNHTVGVGDSYNDYPLLTAVAFKAAMGNAHTELKEFADVVLPPQEEDGVAFLIDELLRNES